MCSLFVSQRDFTSNTACYFSWFYFRVSLYIMYQQASIYPCSKTTIKQKQWWKRPSYSARKKGKYPRATKGKARQKIKGKVKAENKGGENTFLKCKHRGKQGKIKAETTFLHSANIGESKGKSRRRQRQRQRRRQHFFYSANIGESKGKIKAKKRQKKNKAETRQ